MRLALFCVIVFFNFSQGLSQVKGCTDPLATNFDQDAIENDGSCKYPSTSLRPYASLKLQSQFSEISGLLKYDGTLWGHNDNSDCRLYKIDSITGFAKGAVKMNMGLNRDWEDITQDDSFIYMGDFGNNYRGNRKDLTIYLWPKSELADSFEVRDSIRFTYPEQTDFSTKSPNTTNFDCEAMIVVGDSIWLFTKEWGDKNTSVYQLSKQSGIQEAKKIGTIPVDGLVTGAIYNKDYHIVVLLGYSDLLQPFIYLIYDLNNTDFQRCNKRKVSLDLPFYQTEAIEWMDAYTLAVGNERFSNSFVNTLESLQYFNLSFLLGDFYQRSLHLDNFESSTMRFEIAENPSSGNGNSRLIIRGANRCLLMQQPVHVLTETGAKIKTLWMNANSLDLPKLEAGIYLVGNSEFGFVKWIVN